MKSEYRSIILILLVVTIFIFYVYTFSGYPTQTQSQQTDQQPKQLSLTNQVPNHVYASDSSGLVASVDINNVFIPPKTIIMFYGDLIPSGWVECNGENGTPDLRDRFPLAYDDSRNSRAQPLGKPEQSRDGKRRVSLDITQIPAHTHSFTQRGTETCKNGTFSSTGGCWLGGPPTTQDVDTSAVGSTEEHDNMPPFYVLKFIMKR